MTTAAFAAAGTVNGVSNNGTAPAAVGELGSIFISGTPFKIYVADTALNITTDTDPTNYTPVLAWLKASANSGADVTSAFVATGYEIAAGGVNLTVTTTNTGASPVAYTNLQFYLEDGASNKTALSTAITSLTINPNRPETFIAPFPAIAFPAASANLTVNQTVTVNVPKTDFHFTTTGDLTKPYPTSILGLPAGLTATVDSTTSATDVIVTFKAAAAYTVIPAGSGIKFNGDTGSGTSYPAITIKTGLPETLNSAPALTGTIPTSMVVGDKFTLTAAKGSFGWTNTGNGIQDWASQTLSLSGVPAGLSASVDKTATATSDGSHVIVTFTAVSPAASVAANTAVAWSTGQTAVTFPAITIAAAVVPTKPDSMTKGLDTNYSVNTAAGLKDPDNLTVHAGDKIYLPLTGDMFGGNTKSAMTESNLKSKKLTIRISSGSNSKLIDAYKITTGTFSIGGVSLKTAAVEIAFVEPFRSIKDMDFDVNVYPTFDGSRRDEYSIRLTGTMTVNLTEVDATDDYVALEGTHVADAQEYIRLIEADLGEGVSVWGKMYSGKQYWGKATTEPTEADEKIFDKYPSVEMVFNVDTIGLNSTANYVTLDVDDNYYVYDANMKYLGRSNDKLPYSTKYYLSTKKLSIADEVEEDDGDYDEPVPDDLVNPAPNKNDNPGTGR